MALLGLVLRRILVRAQSARHVRERKRESYFFFLAHVSRFAIAPQTLPERPQKCLQRRLVLHLQLCEYAGQFQL